MLVNKIAICLILWILQLNGSAESSRLVNVKAVFPRNNSTSGASRLWLSGTLPELRDVSVCVWANAAGTVPPAGKYIVSYAHETVDNELLVGFRPLEDGGVKLHIFIRGQETFIVSTKIQLGFWHHLCVSWSSGKGRVTAYVDGKLAGSSEGIQEGESIRSGGALVLGQDQDKYNGGFDSNQAWEGTMADLQIWDEVLQEETINAIAQCRLHLDGNVVSWMRTPFRAFDNVILSGANLCVSNNGNNKICNYENSRQRISGSIEADFVNVN